MKILLMCYFSAIEGPKIFLSEPASLGEEYGKIPDLMSLYKEGFFIHEFGGFKSANLIFNLPSKYARGKEEMLMVSLIATNDQIDPGLSREILESFKDEVLGLKDAYKAFYMGSNKHKGDPKKLAFLEELIKKYYMSIPSETMVFKPKNANIFIFGLDKAGKTTIIRALQNKIFKETPPTIAMDISKILIQNLQIMVYDAPGQSRFRNLWTPQLNNQHGLVFVLDVTDEGRFQEASDALHGILTHDDAMDLPLLILFNKVDLLPKVKVKRILKEISNSSLKNRTYKLFPTSGLTGKGIIKSFTWLADELSSTLKG